MKLFGVDQLQNWKLPSSFSDFLKVVISADGPHLEGEPHPNALEVILVCGILCMKKILIIIAHSNFTIGIV